MRNMRTIIKEQEMDTYVRMYVCIYRERIGHRTGITARSVSARLFPGMHRTKMKGLESSRPFSGVGRAASHRIAETFASAYI